MKPLFWRGASLLTLQNQQLLILSRHLFPNVMIDAVRNL
jgi:hypothetical protein